MILLEWIVVVGIVLVVWLFLSQFLAYFFLTFPSKDKPSEDDVLGMWVGIFLFAPLFLPILIIWLIVKGLRLLRQDTSPISPDEIIPY